MREYYIDGDFDMWGPKFRYIALEDTKLILHSNKNRKHLEFLIASGIWDLYKTRKLVRGILKDYIITMRIA